MKSIPANWTHLVRRMRGDLIAKETVHVGLGSANNAFNGAQRVKDPYTAILIICRDTRTVIAQTNGRRFGTPKSAKGVPRNYDPYEREKKKNERKDRASGSPERLLKEDGANPKKVFPFRGGR